MARGIQVRRWPVGLLLGLLVAGPAVALEEAAVERALQFSQQQLTRMATRLKVGQYPKSTGPDGTIQTTPATDMTGWTQGFFPGELWLMYGLTGASSWRTLAEDWTRALEVQRGNTQTHDLGFKFIPSYGHAYQLTGDPYYQDILLQAAASLATRYDEKVGVINTCDWNPDWHLPTVIDTMMNLELLFWAANHGGPAEWKDMALHHALRTLEDLVRADGGTFHVVDYDPESGAILSKETYQGHADGSTWARGQAWAMYGFTLAYRYTLDPRMLGAARKVTDAFLSRLSGDFVPNWDFDAPEQRKDSSAAAAAAAALLELHLYETDPVQRERYRSAAVRILESLTSSAYLAAGTGSAGILLHGVGHLPAGHEVDVGLVYGDYYFIEALTRYRQLPRGEGGWPSKRDFAGSLYPLGTGNTGVLTVEFDVTPHGQSIDGVVGYVSRSAAVSSYEDLPVLLRMNPSGVFEARDGSAYAALTRVAYTAHQTYHVRMVVDLPARNYSVWLTPPGRPEVPLADRFAFRPGALPLEDLGQVSLKSVQIDKEFTVERHAVKASATPPAPGEPVPEVPPEEAPPEEEVPQEQPPGGLERTAGGCAAAPGSAGAAWGVLLLAALMAARRAQGR
ncbi:glycoside hydrolase family 88 protein [Stigmatella sp. ncwal1]|uniref:Glycoside hydrolase family 88 protein n=1 Tax=Stigmatella ashevillensis TaxID=2995309 RepID=A0ABT5DS72_9BACT|nr:glycoside hydrolase family 88 protein [Stigmatella ashevillena]MDC0715232.1 glycoside hydrolase family 88 protein [Stigmatella ashevillena]